PGELASAGVEFPGRVAAALLHGGLQGLDEGRVLAKDRSERLLFDLDERRLGHGPTGRGARPTRQEADLPESRAGVQDRQLAALTRGPLDRDGDFPRLDQEHRGAAVSLAHDDLARGITDLSRSFDEPLALRIRKR